MLRKTINGYSRPSIYSPGKFDSNPAALPLQYPGHVSIMACRLTSLTHLRWRPSTRCCQSPSLPLPQRSWPSSTARPAWWTRPTSTAGMPSHMSPWFTLHLCKYQQQSDERFRHRRSEKRRLTKQEQKLWSLSTFPFQLRVHPLILTLCADTITSCSGSPEVTHRAEIWATS